MPDVLTHYALSYLVANRMVKHMYAVLFALIVLLPDVNTLLRIHKWITHSLVLAMTVILVASILLLYVNHKYLEYLALASTL